MDYTAHTELDRKEMMEYIGIKTIEDLFSDIPERYRLKSVLNLPAPLSEQEIFKEMKYYSTGNIIPQTTLTGAGSYHHYIPAVVGHIISRSEFYTAYTPYQAEISQGILQAIYEYQTMIAKLTGMQVANASMYDGASAMSEASVLAAKTLNRSKIVIARTVHPEYRQTVKTYAWSNGYQVEEIPYTKSGQVDISALESAVDENTAAVIVQSPNFFGIIEDIAAIELPVHRKKALLVSGFTEATSLGILKPAGELGADFVVGEGQSFGNPMNYGGPYLGIFAGTGQFIRKIPGRLAGATIDREGQRGFVLTLQTREQHIRREKATSNICSNEALCALAAAVYLACMGKNLKRLAELNIRKACYLKDKLTGIAGWSSVFSAPTYNEFAIRCPDPGHVNLKLRDNGIAGGYELEKDYPELKNVLLLCATEMMTRDEIDRIVEILK